MDLQFSFGHIISLIGLIISGYLGYRYGLRYSQQKQRMEYIEKQIKEFYSPMVGIIKDIRAKGKIRYEISKACDREWRKLTDGMSPREFESSTQVDIHRKAIMDNIEYENQQLRNQIIPAYKKMLIIFQDKLWLADPQTLKWFDKFNHFVDIWERYLLGNYFPPEIMEQVRVSENGLQPFYKELENRLEILREQLEKGKPA